MDRTFNSHNYKINQLLKSANLEHLHVKMMQKCVTLDTFLNLTDDDLDYLEIHDPDDRHALINNFNIHHQHFQHVLNPPPFNRNKMLTTNLQHLKAINSLTSTILNQVTIQEATGTFDNRLIDDVTPVSKVIDLLTAQALTSIDLIESDLKKEIERIEGSNPKWMRSKIIAGVLLAGSLTLAVLLCSSHLRVSKPVSPSTYN